MKAVRFLPGLSAVIAGLAVFFLFGGMETVESSGTYACPMLCVVLPDPGLCPVCGMELEQIQQTGDTITVSDRGRELAGLSSVEAAGKELHYTIRAPASVVAGEENTVSVSAFSSGRLTDVRVTGPGQRVERGEILAVAYSVEIYRAQSDYLAALSTGEGLLVQTAERRLAELGSPVPSSGSSPSGNLYITSPVSGTVSQVLLNSGEWFNRGDVFASVLEDFGDELLIYAPSESVNLLLPGQKVLIHDELFTEIARVAPVLHGESQTLICYAPLPDSAGYPLGARLTVEISVPLPSSAVSVPENAVLFLGERAVVYVELEESRYVPRVVDLGTSGTDTMGDVWYPVNSGVLPGERVVLDGAFLLDSQAELTGIQSLVNSGVSE